MKESGGTTEVVADGEWHKVFLTSFAEVTLAEAFLGSKSVNPLATAPLTW